MNNGEVREEAENYFGKKSLSSAHQNHPCHQCGDSLRSSSLLIQRQDQDRWVGRSGSSSPHPATHHPLPLGRRPNNEKIYDHPWSLLAPSPWATTRSSCTDLLECPKAWEPLLVGSSSSPPHRTSKYKASWDTVQNTDDQRTASTQ